MLSVTVHVNQGHGIALTFSRTELQCRILICSIQAVWFKSLSKRFPCNLGMSLSCSLLVWVFLIAASYYLCLWKDDVSLKEKRKEQFYFVSNWFDTRIVLFASGEHNLYHKELGLSEQTHTFVYRCMCTGFHFWQKGRAWQGRDKASLTSLMANSCTIVIRLFRVGVFKSLQLLLFCSEHRR